MKRIDRLQYHPDQYVKLDEPLILFVGKSVSQNDFETLRDILSKRTSPLIFSGSFNNQKKEYKYDLEFPSFSVVVYEPENGKRNLACATFNHPKSNVNSFYNDPHKKMFLIEATAGYMLVHIFPDDTREVYKVDPHDPDPVTELENVSWDMGDGTYWNLLKKMHQYFSGKEDVSNTWVTEEMNENVMLPFDMYTQGEYDFEERKVDFTKALNYVSRKVGAVAMGKKSTYIFFSQDSKYDPEEPLYVPGNRLGIYRKDKTATGINGLLVDVDTDSREGVLLTLEFYQQFDLSQLPEEGFLFIAPNNTQLKIRQNVSRSIRYGKTPAKYMYRLFDDFHVEGYDSPSDKIHAGLIPFLEKRLASQYPPNQMQLEAIVKGVLTQDTLLVLGPPGTGKTTVILSWVDYFISQGKRVLISSQNNSAVDNVLERCDPNYEIVRLGRSEKVQENCRHFLPENRIASMRRTCEENYRILTGLLNEDCQKVYTYRRALDTQQELLTQQMTLTTQLNDAKKRISQLASDIRESHESSEKAQEQFDIACSQAEKYTIFLEESNRRNVLVRWLQRPLRRIAQEKIDLCQRSIRAAENALSAARQTYNQSADALQKALAALREEKLLARLQENRQKAFLGNQRLSMLMPKFTSELSSLKILEDRPRFSLIPMENLDRIFAENLLMGEVLNAAEKIRSAAKAWSDAVHRDERNDIFQEILLETCQVVGATCVGINSNKSFASVDFDVTIIDESGQIQIHNALIPMSRSPRTLMLGDYKQIPPIVNNDILATLRMNQFPTGLYEQSFFQYLFEQLRRKEIRRLVKKPELLMVSEEDLPEDEEARKQQLLRLARDKILEPVAADYDGTPNESLDSDEEDPEYTCRYTPAQLTNFVNQIIGNRKKIVNLNSQFRMPGNISDVISQWFYESNYFSSYDITKFKPVVPGTDKPMVIIDTGACPERYETKLKSGGYYNEPEAKVVAQVLLAVLSQKSEAEQEKYKESLGKNLGIISAYSAQVRAIRKELCGAGFSTAQAETAVASLDSFQGQERDLIIYSLTRSSQKSRTAARVGFLKELRRLNVAFTRCKKQLVIIGDLTYLKECLYVKNEDCATPDTEDDTQEQEDPFRDLPCANTDDAVIDKDIHILQCAECPLDCERRFARFFRLLLQHATRKENPAGNVYTVEEFENLLKGGADNGA